MCTRSLLGVARTRFAGLGVLAALALSASCADEKADKPDVETSQDAGTDASVPKSSSLPRPGLERPPTNGLPADLRPPR